MFFFFFFFGNSRIRSNPRFFGRTDLRISLSRAKFDEEVDFEVYFAVALQHRRQISEKRNFRSKKFANLFFDVEQRKVQNRPKRALAKFRGDPSHA